MGNGELLTRVSIWLALVFYVIGEVGRLRWQRNQVTSSWFRWFWTLGCGFIVLHAISAFEVFYCWSHASAYANTARQTKVLVGLDWGGGIFFNYSFTALWMFETVWWWLAPQNYRLRLRAWDTVIRGFFLFMIINGAIVFVQWPLKWLGMAVVTALLFVWWKESKSLSPST